MYANKESGIVIVPADKDFDYLYKIIKKVKNISYLDLLIIDNTSAQSLHPHYPNTKIIRNKIKGKGISLQKGFRYAIKKKYSYVIVFDADGEHPVEKIALIKEKIKTNDLVLGQRKEFRSLLRKFLNKFSNFWLRLMGLKIKDSQCGLKGIKTDCLKEIEITEKGFAIDLQILLECYKRNKRVSTFDFSPGRVLKSSVNMKDYIEINNFFDRWIINNIKIYNRNLIKKYFLYVSARIGLLFGSFFGKLYQ